ncbi:unnamed protein product [marine sediment metagenome]|uniref:Uncharacterized protein n=1 Tax=marine sediment metagenome TaxID=412755 RepID=X1M8Q1_9ZZZZ
MTISEKCDRVSALLVRLKRYDAIVKGDNFSPEAMDELKSNTKDILSDIDDEVSLIEDEVDDW